jgi:tRNA pseudouridine38-40 synthase
VALKKFKLTLAFDGTNYQGWQTQKIGIGAQQIVEQALARLFPSHPILHGSSRTDSGVHALGLVAHFEVPTEEVKMTDAKLILGINAWLPDDIRIFDASSVPRRFHARFDALEKEYRYCVWNRPSMNPLLRRTAWHMPRPLNFTAMKRAASAFLGRHDFRAFTANPGYARAQTVRTVTHCQVRREEGLLTFVIRGDGFLYKMCRGIVGTIIQTGLGKFRAEEILPILKTKDRRLAGMTAPAHGLVLWEVFYPPAKPGKVTARKPRAAIQSP